MNKEMKKLSFLGKLSIYDLLEDNIPEAHKVFSFSFHNHWLTYEESLLTPMSYHQIISTNSNISDYKKFEEKLLKLFNYLYKNYSLYSIILNEDKEELHSFDSFNEVKNLLKDLLEEKAQINIIVQQLKIVILSNYDLTFPVYVLDENADKVKKIFKDFDINILD